MDESKVLRVVGLGSSLPLDPGDPLNAINRRISLVVLNDATERQIRGLAEGRDVEIDSEAEAAEALEHAAPDGAGNEPPPRPAPAPATIERGAMTPPLEPV
jgi:chemotaxis protein MotB